MSSGPALKRGLGGGIVWGGNVVVGQFGVPETTTLHGTFTLLVAEVFAVLLMVVLGMAGYRAIFLCLLPWDGLSTLVSQVPQR